MLRMFLQCSSREQWRYAGEMRVVWREIISLDLTWSAVNDTHISFPPVPSTPSAPSLPP